MKIRFVISLLLILAAQSASDTLAVFKSNTKAMAAEVNANFTLLSARIDSLSKALAAANANNQLPIGTVAAFLVSPGADGYLPGSNSTWIIAAGQTVGDITVPDMRGRFLRGVYYTVTGCSTTMIDPDGERTAGSVQEDAIQTHAHYTPIQTAVSNGAGGGYSVAFDNRGSGWNRFLTSEPEKDTLKARISSETRPKNIGVFWYVKVK